MSGVAVAVVTAVLIAAALGVSRPIGRWLVKSLSVSFAEMVQGIVGPQFDALGRKLDAAQRQNSIEHAETSKRLGAVETELALLTERVTALEPKEEQ